MLNRIKAAVTERNEQVLIFDEFHQALPEEQTAIWKASVEKWEADPRKNENPFHIIRRGKYLASYRDG